MELPLKHREWFQEKDQSLFIQMLSTCLTCLFTISFLLVRDILCGHLWYKHKNNHKQKFQRCFCSSRFIKIASEIFFFIYSIFFCLTFDLTLYKIAKTILGLSPIASKSRYE